MTHNEQRLIDILKHLIVVFEKRIETDTEERAILIAKSEVRSISGDLLWPLKQ